HPRSVPDLRSDLIGQGKIPTVLYLSSLKFATPFFRPAFDHHFGLCEKLDRVFSLAVEITEEALLPTRKRKLSNGRCNTDINSDIASLCLTSKSTRVLPTRREYAGHISIAVFIDECDRIVNRIQMYQTHHRTKYFSVN